MNAEPIYIDITPTWVEAAEMLIVALENGTTEGKRLAREEFRRIGRTLDKALDERKHIRNHFAAGCGDGGLSEAACAALLERMGGIECKP